MDKSREELISELQDICSWDAMGSDPCLPVRVFRALEASAIMLSAPAPSAPQESVIEAEGRRVWAEALVADSANQPDKSYDESLQFAEQVFIEYMKRFGKRFGGTTDGH